MKAIYERDILYSALRPYVDWCCRYSYSRFEIHGKENIPSDGAVILAPNHTNTLMDALVMLMAHKGPTVFGARADIFKKPAIAKIMHFMRIIPMVRQRDGLRNVLKNHESTGTIVGTLEHGVRFCIFPEGRHRTMHSLLPLGKGVLRAAAAANSKFGSLKPVYIVPVGIEYGDWFRYRSTCLITYGKPINVTEFIKKSGTDNEARIFEPLRKELASRMSQLITYIKDDEEYDGKSALMDLLAGRRRCRSLYGRMQCNRDVISRIEHAEEVYADKMKAVSGQAEEFCAEMRTRRMSHRSSGKKHQVANVVLNGMAAFAMLPYFMFCAIASLPMWAAFIALKKKLKDRAFHNTAGFGIKLAAGPFMFIIWTILSFCLLSWPLALAVSLLTIPSYSFFHDYVEFIRRWTSDLRFLHDKEMRERYRGICQEAETLLDNAKQ